MGTRKKSGIEMVFNLEWRIKPDNGGVSGGVIGMRDTLQTTGNFQNFKLYLLKNSGVCSDVKVTFVMDSGTQWPIETESDFQVALCAFRLKSRLGEIICLKLDTRGVLTGAVPKQSSNVQTQIEISPEQSLEVAPEWFINYMAKFKREIVEEISGSIQRKDSLIAAIEHPSIEVIMPPNPEFRKKQVEFPKRKLNTGEPMANKDFWRSLKCERKLDIKLDKLDAKSKKIREKKLALLGLKEYKEKEPKKERKVETKVTKAESKDKPIETVEDGSMMSATLLSKSKDIPRMVGGECFMQIWDVKNTGKLPWTTNTKLRLTWGSSEMKPEQTTLLCPELKPGERGTIFCKFEIPKKPGSYESYWNFYDSENRFGDWLSFCVIVEPFDWRYAVTEESPKTVNKSKRSVTYVNNTIEEKPINISVKEEVSNLGTNQAVDSDVIDLSTRIQDLNLQEILYADWENTFGSEEIDKKENKSYTFNRSGSYGIDEKDLIVDLSTSKANKVVEEVKIEKNGDECKQLITDAPIEANNDNNNNDDGSIDNNISEESICEVRSEASSDISSGYDVIASSLCDEDESGYVYITIDGNKLSVPRYIIRPDFLASAEKAPEPIKYEQLQSSLQSAQSKEIFASAEVLNEATNEERKSLNNGIETLCNAMESLEKNIKETMYLSHGESGRKYYQRIEKKEPSNERMFVFPQENPGFEVVEPKNYCPTNQAEVPAKDPPHTYTWANSNSQYLISEGNANLIEVPRCRMEPIRRLEGVASPVSSSSSSRPANLNPIPNYQQTPASARQSPRSSTPTNPPSAPHQTESANIQILPENLVTGAVNVASSALNTARSVINLIVPPKESGRWENGHWVNENPESTRAKNLRLLTEMGFWDIDLNATLLARYKDDMARVISELIQ